MSGLKQQVIQMIRALPDKVSVDDILSELYFKLQVDKGLKELDAGKGISHQAAKKRLGRWLNPK